MTNRYTLKFSILAAAALALSLPVVAAAQWGRYPQNRYPDDRDYRYGRYDGRALRDSVHRLDRLAKDFERDVDRSLDRSRINGTRYEDHLNDHAHAFRRAVGNLKSRVGNGRDLNRSADEARRVLQVGEELDHIARPGVFNSRLASEWYGIQQELRFISDVYGFRYNGGYGRDDDYRRRDRSRDRNNDWWRNIPFPRY